MADKIKILYLQKTAQIGGAEKDLIALLEKLNKDFFTPLVVVSEKGLLTEKLTELNIPYYLIPLYPWRKSKYFFLKYISILKLDRLIKNLGINIIHSNDFWHFPYAKILKIFNPSVKIITHVRGEVNRKKFLAYKLKKADKIVVVSYAIKSELEKSNMSSDKILVHYGYLSINFSDREEQSKKHDKFLVGTITRLFSIKGLEYLIRAGKEIKKHIPNGQIMIIGNGDRSYINYLQKLVKELHLENYVSFLGYQENIFKYLKMIDIFILPSLSEGLGLAVLEAMSAAKPIIVTDIPAMRELLKNRVNALIVPAANHHAIAEAVIELHKDHRLREKLGKKAKETFQDIYTPAKFLSQLQDTYLCLFQQKS